MFFHLYANNIVCKQHVQLTLYIVYVQLLYNELTVCPTEVEFSGGKLVSMLTILLETETELATHSLGGSLRHLTLALCRLPLFHEAAMTPAALKGDEKISVKMLDQALMESEVVTVHDQSL